MKLNQKYITAEFNPNTKCTVQSRAVIFSKEAVMFSYVPMCNKAVVML